jgi:serine/threonine protein kinase
LGGKPIFKGRDYVDQLNQILNYLGTPSEEALRRVGSPRVSLQQSKLCPFLSHTLSQAQDYIRSLPFKPKIPFQQLYPSANPLALDLLEKMLEFDPARRISCNQALRHPYLAVWHDPQDEPTCPRKFDFGFEMVDDIEGMKHLILKEVASFREEVRSRARMGQAKRQDSLPIPSREEIQAASPLESSSSQSMLGASSGLVQGGTATETASGQLSDAQMMEDPSEAFEREIQAK